MKNKLKIIFFLLIVSFFTARCGVINFPEFSKKGDKPEPTSTDHHVTQTARVIEETETFILSKYLWFIEKGSLIQIDTEFNKVASITDFDYKVFDVSAGPGFIWVANSENNQVLQLDPITKDIKNSYYIVQGQIECLSANDKGVWAGISIAPINKISSSTGGIIKIDQNMNEVVDLIHTRGVPTQIQIVEDEVWVLERTQSATLFETFNLKDQVISAIPDKHISPEFIHYFSDFTINDNSIWAIPLNEISNYIFKVDKFNGQIIQKFYVGGNQNPVDIVTVNDIIWVALNNGEILIIDPSTDEVISRINIGLSLSRMYKKEEYLWLLRFSDAQILKFDPYTQKIEDGFSIGISPQAKASSTPRFRHEETGPTCEGANPPGFEVGSIARVKSDPPLPNRVRVEPYNDTEILGQVEPGETMVILEGPVCSTGWVWWKIQAEKDGLIGWMAEGDGGTVWLEKLQ